MEESLLKILFQQGPFAALFVWLLLSTKKEAREREHLPDPGACGCGLEEYKVAAELGSAVKMHLERHNVKVVLTRTGPHSLSSARDLKQNKREDLNKRVVIANAADPDLFVSFH